MRKQLALGAVLALSFGSSAMAAEEVSFSFVEAGYLQAEVDDLNIDGSGFTISGSVAITENLFAFASMRDLDFDAGVSSNHISAGVGFNWALGARLDLVAGAAYERAQAKVSGLGSASETGYRVNTGLRGRAGNLELSAGASYGELGDGADDFTIRAGGRWYVTRAFAVGPDVSHNDDGIAWAVSLRYDFSRR